MTQIAPLKPERFENVVSEYIDYRVKYDQALIDWLAQDTGVTLESTVLDLGCGPGFIAHAIAPHAGHVVGVDPSPAMIAAAQENAPQNTRFIEGSSFDLSFLEPGLQLVTMGRSFHWMDREATLVTLNGLVAENGALAILADRPIGGPRTAWWRAIEEVARSYATGDDYDAFRKTDEWEPHEEPLLRSDFNQLSQITSYRTEKWNYESILGLIFSRSGTTPERLGDRRASLESDVKDTLALFGEGPWTTLNRHTALIARRA